LTLTIFVIRHGEKPEKNSDSIGLNVDGEKDKLGLTIRGWQRAGAWATLFGSSGASQLYLRPHRIYAVNPDQGVNGEDPSHRAFQTVMPLADRLAMKVDISFKQGAEDALFKQVSSQTGVLLICWEHKSIGTGLLPAFFGSHLPANVPPKWDKTRFDVVFKLSRDGFNSEWSFEQLFPITLCGDSDEPMK